MVLTFLIVFYIVGDEKHDKSEDLLIKLGVDQDEIKNAKSPKDANFLSILFYLATEYCFDISCFFGLSRQFILTYYSQSHAIYILSIYQPVIFLSVAWIVIWLANVKYNDIAAKVARQNIIFKKLNMDALKNHQFNEKKERNGILLSSIIVIIISFSGFIGVQYYLSGSISITNPYSLSIFVSVLLAISLLSYVFWGKEKPYWDTLWSSFMAISGTLGFIFFGKIVLMAVFGHLVSDFYYCSGVGIFIGIAVAVGVLYSQIIQHFSVSEYRVSMINKIIESGDIQIDSITRLSAQDASINSSRDVVAPLQEDSDLKRSSRL